MEDYEDYDSSDEYSSEYPNCQPLATNFYLYSYWWVTIIAQVLIIVIMINNIIIVAFIIIFNMFSDPVLLSVSNNVRTSQQKLSLHGQAGRCDTHTLLSGAHNVITVLTVLLMIFVPTLVGF